MLFHVIKIQPKITWSMLNPYIFFDTKKLLCLGDKLCDQYQNFLMHFSHVTKSHIFKNLDLRRKANRDFRGNLLENHFRHLKLYSNPPSWLATSRCHIDTFRKTKAWSSHFWQGQTFRFCYVGIHHQRRLKLTKASKNYRLLV